MTTPELLARCNQLGGWFLDGNGAVRRIESQAREFPFEQDPVTAVCYLMTGKALFPTQISYAAELIGLPYLQLQQIANAGDWPAHIHLEEQTKDLRAQLLAVCGLREKGAPHA